MDEKMRYYFEICFNGNKINHKDERAEITKEEAYATLHFYKLKDSDWIGEDICLRSNSEMMYFLVKTTKDLEVTVTRQ